MILQQCINEVSVLNDSQQLTPPRSSSSSSRPFPMSRRIALCNPTSQQERCVMCKSVLPVWMSSRARGDTRYRPRCEIIFLRCPVTLSALLLQQLLRGSVCCEGNPLVWQVKQPISDGLRSPLCMSQPIRGKELQRAAGSLQFRTTGAVQTLVT